MSEEEEIKRFILRKLVRHRIWMHKHTSIHNLQKGLPDWLRSKKEVRFVIDELLKQKILFFLWKNSPWILTIRK